MVLLAADALSLYYPIANVRSRSLRGQLAAFGSGGILRKGDNKSAVVEALRDVNFELRNGDRLGLIGRNGAGKSTLLKVLAGIYPPTKGRIRRQGKVATLFDVGLGMDEDASGIENIRLAGTLAGLSQEQINHFLPEVCEFSELGDFLAMPIRTYSSGMRMRLAFSVATQMDPKILLMDEIFGAGDAFFARKAERRVAQIIENSHILVLATHSDALIQSFCNKALWLERGEMRAVGEVHLVLDAYRESHRAQYASAAPPANSAPPDSPPADADTDADAEEPASRQTQAATPVILDRIFSFAELRSIAQGSAAASAPPPVLFMNILGNVSRSVRKTLERAYHAHNKLSEADFLGQLSSGALTSAINAARHDIDPTPFAFSESGGFNSSIHRLFPCRYALIAQLREPISRWVALHTFFRDTPGNAFHDAVVEEKLGVAAFVERHAPDFRMQYEYFLTATAQSVPKQDVAAALENLEAYAAIIGLHEDPDGFRADLAVLLGITAPVFDRGQPIMREREEHALTAMDSREHAALTERLDADIRFYNGAKDILASRHEALQPMLGQTRAVILEMKQTDDAQRRKLAVASGIHPWDNFFD